MVKILDFISLFRYNTIIDIYDITIIIITGNRVHINSKFWFSIIILFVNFFFFIDMIMVSIIIIIISRVILSFNLFMFIILIEFLIKNDVFMIFIIINNF